MRHLLLKLVRNTFLYYPLRNWIFILRQKGDFRKWEKSGYPIPPPHLAKQKIITEYQASYKITIMVETGTYCGDMVYALKKKFKKIISIELSEKLHHLACRRFRHSKNIELICGDSGTKIKGVTKSLKEPALFWLDGHQCDGFHTSRADNNTPLYKELEHIFNSDIEGHVILIDDVRCFGADPEYPEVETLKNYVMSNSKYRGFENKDDIIRITP